MRPVATRHVRDVNAYIGDRFAGLVVPDEGIEPPTFGLQNRCSTAELIRLPVRDGSEISAARVHLKDVALP